MLQGKYLSVFSGKAAGVRPGSVALRDSSGSHAAFPKDELGDPFATMRRLYSRDLGKGLMSGLRSGSFGSWQPTSAAQRIEKLGEQPGREAAVSRWSRRLPGSLVRRSIAAKTTSTASRLRRDGFAAPEAGVGRCRKPTRGSSRRSSGWSNRRHWAIPCDP
jgi:hypothetical protein